MKNKCFIIMKSEFRYDDRDCLDLVCEKPVCVVFDKTVAENMSNKLNKERPDRMNGYCEYYFTECEAQF